MHALEYPKDELSKVPAYPRQIGIQLHRSWSGRDALDFLPLVDMDALVVRNAIAHEHVVILGDTVRFEFYGPPGEVFLVVKAGDTGYFSYPGFHGYGGFYVDPNDPWLNLVLQMAGNSVIVLDGQGRYGIDYALPTAALYGTSWRGDEGWSVQLLSAAGEISAPLRIQRP